MTSKQEKNSSAPSKSSDQLGVKHDQGKLRFDLVDPEWEEGLADIMTHGAEKYGERNWEKGMNTSRLYAAARRHISLFIKGQALDEESGKHHLFHANACLMMAWKLSADPKWDDREELTSGNSNLYRLHA